MGHDDSVGHKMLDHAVEVLAAGKHLASVFVDGMNTPIEAARIDVNQGYARLSRPGQGEHLVRIARINRLVLHLTQPERHPRQAPVLRGPGPRRAL